MEPYLVKWKMLVSLDVINCVVPGNRFLPFLMFVPALIFDESRVGCGIAIQV